MRRSLILAGVALLSVPAAASAEMVPTTTSYATIAGDTSKAFSGLDLRPGWKRVIRTELAQPLRGRHKRRDSILYFAQISDYQLADEESPARVEALDQDGTPFTSAWRPQEALEPHTIDLVHRQVNAFAARSPIRHRRNRYAPMGVAILTGDNADNQQANEVRWVRQLLEGGRIDPNSGIEGGGPCPAGPVAAGEAARYSGVQDYDDTGVNAMFYDPDQPLGRYAPWPRWPGLMDRAQQPFETVGLRVPSYLSFGNHDGTVQGNAWANAGFDAVATGCAKALSVPGAQAAFAGQAFTGVAVPRDPERRFVSRAELMRITGEGTQADDHGFALVDAEERRASSGQASYYAVEPRPGLRFLSINTVGEGSGIDDGGNLDDPQFRWVERELKAADAAGKLVILFGHHPIRSMNNDTHDENAPACGASSPHPGCDGDPRDSRPIHLGPDLQKLLTEHRSAIAYVAGHTHEHKVTPFKREDGTGFWGIETASETDWPIQSRLLEVMDNRDGTLSIFGTALDHGADLPLPPDGAPAASFGVETMATVARALSFNDPQVGGTEGLGEPKDRNVELVLRDPRPR